MLKDTVTFNIDENSTFGDKKIIKRITPMDNGQKSYEFFKYIGRREKGNYVYYKLEGEPSDAVATYTRIEPLGYRNSFIEYEYGKDASDIQTVIEKNLKSYDPYAETLARFDDGRDTGIIDYDAIPINNMTSLDDVAESLGFNLKSSPSSNDITSIEPNNEFRDAENKPTCGI